MFSSSDESKAASPLIDQAPLVDDNNGADSVTYHSLHPEPVMGCKHYMRNCKKWAECCGEWITCRFCHDERQDHQLDRFSTKRMLCMLCKTDQPAGRKCAECHKVMASYYCDICKFWDADPLKNIYHCAKCGICRVGLQSEYIHCDKCNACISTDYHPQHKCIERSLECDCVICGEYLFTSTAPVMLMPCGHSIHFICHREHMKTSYQCPVCWKSLGDMKEYFARIDALLVDQKMPAEYALVRSQILCNDCEEKSCCKFHFVYHKCKACGSYNTKVVKTFNVEDEEDEGEPPASSIESGEMDSNDAANSG